MTVRASPLTHASLKPNSLVKETALRHAFASTIIESRMFSHRYVYEAMTQPSLFRAKTLEHEAFPLGSEYSSPKLVRKVLRLLLERFITKVTTMEEAKYIDAMKIDKLIVDKLIGTFQTFKINMEKVKKGKSKYEKNIAFSVVENVPNKQSVVIKEI
ncbi:hypothetical protein J1N35_013775 [Gossypium stocksii]|uniref:Uncharacterized protein n=1 Tax=Gossypium stocksii TaxID=47602 RepID=A0A9D3VVR7_9ROSI|nr:hypothetical protein J1N35_013775 [Gossypium stocksii]